MSAAEYFVGALGWVLMLYYQSKAARVERRFDDLTGAYLEDVDTLLSEVDRLTAENARLGDQIRALHDLYGAGCTCATCVPV